MFRFHSFWTATLLCLTALLPFQAAASPPPPHVRLILLGTMGGPPIFSDNRLPQSTALMIGDDLYLLDAGYGASLRLVQAGIPLARLKGVFITHLHSDHVLDYPSVLMNSWASGLKQPVRVFGPSGTQAMTANTWKTFQADIGLRIDDEGKPDPRELVTVKEIDEGLVYRDEQLKVSALRVPHPPFKDGQAFAYKFEAGGKTIVLSGDLNYFPPLAEFAKGADVLISEAMHVKAVERLAKRIGNDTLVKAIISHHVTAEDVGRIAQQAGVKKLVLSHLVPADDSLITDQVWRDTVGKTYHGPIVVGADGMEINLND